MGVDAGDYNGDGLPDLIVTNFSHDYNTLYENGPAGVFTDRSYATGIAPTAGPYLGWGVKFVDIDNDGRLDIFIANGHVYPEVDKHGLGTRYQQRKQIFLNEGTRFRHASAEIGGGLADGEVQPRRCVRRLRQRRRHRRARHQHERSADAAAQRYGVRTSLDHRATRRPQEQSRRHRRAGSVSKQASGGRRPWFAATAATCRTATRGRTSVSASRRVWIDSKSAGRAESSTRRPGSRPIASMSRVRGRGFAPLRAESAGFPTQGSRIASFAWSAQRAARSSEPEQSAVQLNALVVPISRSMCRPWPGTTRMTSLWKVIHHSFNSFPHRPSTEVQKQTDSTVSDA